MHHQEYTGHHQSADLTALEYTFTGDTADITAAQDHTVTQDHGADLIIIEENAVVQDVTVAQEVLVVQDVTVAQEVLVVQDVTVAQEQPM
jgi:hypothetical protein